MEEVDGRGEKVGFFDVEVVGAEVGLGGGYAGDLGEGAVNTGGALAEGDVEDGVLRLPLTRSDPTLFELLGRITILLTVNAYMKSFLASNGSNLPLPV